MTIIIIIGIFFFFKKLYLSNKSYKYLKLEKNLYQGNQNISNIEKEIKNLKSFQNITQTPSFSNDIIHKEYNNSMMIEYINEQNNFCNNINGENKGIEDKIKLTNVSFKNISFNMFVYKGNDVVSQDIIKLKIYEEKQLNNVLNALNYYSNKNNIKIKDIYILDIGANVGIYTFVLGKYGYKIISFEPSIINNYILKKNYCINKDVDIILVNKGLFNEEKQCQYHKAYNNIGNGYVVCDKNENSSSNSNIFGKITLTKLSNFFSFLSNKNIILIKIDIEGSEGRAIEGGIELITKYHVPFIIMEFTPKLLKSYNTDPKEFLQLFENNGYKFGIKNFFDEYYSLDYILEQGIRRGLMTIYIVYSKILDK